MADDSADFTVQLIDELDDDERGAQPKFSITATALGGYQQGQNLVDADVGNSLIIQCQLAHVCHGTITKDGHPGTLIVMLFAFQPKRNNSRFKWVDITMTFSGGSNTSEPPEVSRMSPIGEFTLYRSEKTEEISHSINPSLEGSAGPAKGTLGYQWQLTTTQQKEDRATMFGLSRSSRNSAKHDTVVWGFSENKSTKSGIPSLFQSAILLKRQKLLNNALGATFSATLKITGKVNRREEIQGKVQDIEKKMSGKKQKSEDIIFDPRSSNSLIVKNPQRLFEEDLDKFKKLVTIRDWIDGQVEAQVRAGNDTDGLDQMTRDVQAEQPPRGKDTTDTELELPSQSDISVPKTEDEPLLFQDQPATKETSSTTIRTSTKGVPGTSPQVPIADTISTAAEQITQTQKPESAQRMWYQHTFTGQNPAAAANAATEHKLRELREELVQVTDQRLLELYGELAKVRLELNLVRRLLRLEQEEARIMKEIAQLESEKP